MIANTIIHELENTISCIKDISVMADTEKARTGFAYELVSLIGNCAIMLGGDIHVVEPV